MKRFLTGILSVVLIGIVNVPSAGAITFQTGDNLVIDRNINSDAYLLGGNALINRNINGDLYIAGGQVVINGNVREDLVIGGGKVTVNGNVDGDLRVVGGQVTLHGNVAESVVVAGGQFDISERATVSGDVYVGAGLFIVNGVIEGELHGGMGALIINGRVEGDVIVSVEDTLTVSENAEIGGNLNYSALFEATIPENVVAGEVMFNQFRDQPFAQKVTYAFMAQKVVSFLAALILLLLLVGFVPKFLIRAGDITRQNVIKSFMIGFLGFIGVIVGFLLLMLSVVGIPFALLVMAASMVVFYFAKIMACAWIGSYFLNYKKKISKKKMAAVLGFILIGYYIVAMIPYLGWMLNGILFLIGVGTFISVKVDLVKAMRSKKII